MLGSQAAALTAKSLLCYLATCWVSERQLVLCNVAIWRHTVKDHHNFDVQTGHNTSNLYQDRPYGRRRFARRS
jgi:hypothetical protein